MNVIVEHPDSSRSHRDLLRSLVASTTGEIRVASAYVTDRDLLLLGKGRKRRLVTSLLPMDIASGATSLECLRSLIHGSVDIRHFPAHPRLHAKVYLFGEHDAVVTSANMTRNAMESNLEVGVRIFGDDVKTLNIWYERIWSESQRVNIKMLAGLSKSVIELRRQYSTLKAAAVKHLAVPPRKSKGVQSPIAKILKDSKKKCYLVNTNRRYDKQTETGGYVMEEKMLDQGLAVVWESFNFPLHMSAVRAGDIILAFAKKTGIIAVGVAKEQVTVIQGESTDRIRSFAEYSFPEWRIPTHWIVRVDNEDALPFQHAPNASFIDVSGDQYSDLRMSVVDHFVANGL